MAHLGAGERGRALVAGLAGRGGDDVCVGLPLAVVPLWQLAQLLVMPVWLILAPANEVVLLWQVSQAAVVTMWVVGLPLAVVPLWQLAQPGDAGVIILAPANEAVLLWQVSQAAVVTMCVVGLPLAVVPLWQLAQPGDAGMAHLGAGKRGRALVAGLAGRGGDDVRRRLALGGGAVVAAGADR